MKPNIGIVDALIRITLGFTALSWSTSKLVKRRSNRRLPLFIALVGSMKVAEGITRFCPMTQMFEEKIADANHKADMDRMTYC